MLHANPKSKATLDVLWTAAAAMVDVDGEYYWKHSCRALFDDYNRVN